MKRYPHIVIFQKQSEIDYMSRYRNFKLGKVRIYLPTIKDVIGVFRQYSSCAYDFGFELFSFVLSSISLIFCWMPYIGVDMTKEEEE
jgi:hypothetical protein